MKPTSWLAPHGAKIMRVFFSIALVVFWSACSDDTVNPVALGPDAAGKKPLKVQSNSNSTSNSNSQSNPGDYNITVTRVLSQWTYVITKNGGAKDLSHVILNLNNCPTNQTLSIGSITSATVNGVNWPLSSSEGNGTGCELTTDNFVKFDDLPEADSYTIVFTLDVAYRSVHQTTIWLKAGNSCVPYVVDGPCCVFPS
jgi:hypothetical protein